MTGPPCATCGADPVGSFGDGSPRYAVSCDHSPVTAVHPLRAAWDARTGLHAPLSGELDEEAQRLLKPVVKRVADRYAKGKVARMKYLARGRSIEGVVRDGMGAELFTARWLGLEWNRGNRKLPDVADDVEVRQVGRPDGDLSMYEYDHGARRFVLVVGKFPSYRLVGWIFGRDGMVAEFWHGKGEIYRGYTLDISRWIVPADRLRPMHTFGGLDDDVPEAARSPEGSEAPEAQAAEA